MRGKNKILHIANYAVLLSVMVFSLLLFYLLRGFPNYQMVMLIAFSAFYFIWECVFHMIKGDFHLKIMLEYLLVSVLAVLLIRGALFR